MDKSNRILVWTESFCTYINLLTIFDCILLQVMRIKFSRTVNYKSMWFESMCLFSDGVPNIMLTYLKQLSLFANPVYIVNSTRFCSKKRKVVGRKSRKWSMLFHEKVVGMRLRSYSRRQIKMQLLCIVSWYLKEHDHDFGQKLYFCL